MKSGSYVPNSHKKAALRICDYCFRQCGGFCVNFRAKPEFPTYHSCSDGCDDALLSLAIHGQGFIPIAIVRELHSRAIIEARGSVLTAIQQIAPNLPPIDPERIDDLIRVVMAKVMESMRQQSAFTAPGDA